MSSDFTNYPPPDQSMWREVKEEHRPAEPEAEQEPSEQHPLRSEEGAASQPTQSLTQTFKSIFMRGRSPTSTAEQPAPFPHTGTYPPTEKVKSVGKLRCCFDDAATQPPPEGSQEHFKQLWKTHKDLIRNHAETSSNAESFNFLNDMESYRKLCANKKASNRDIAEEYNNIVDERFKEGTALISHSQLPKKIDVDSIDNSSKTRKALKEKLDVQEAEVLGLFSQSFFKGNTYKNLKRQ